MVFLGRVLTWEASGIRYEADPRHAELVVQGLGLQGAKPAVTPGVKESEVRDEDEKSNPFMSSADATSYRALVARLNFLSQDRPDLQYAVKEVSRYMSCLLYTSPSPRDS